MANQARTETSSSSSSEKQRDDREERSSRRLTCVRCLISGLRPRSATVNINSNGSFRMDSKNKKLDSRKGRGTPHEARPHTSFKPATVSKPARGRGAASASSISPNWANQACSFQTTPGRQLRPRPTRKPPRNDGCSAPNPTRTRIANLTEGQHQRCTIAPTSVNREVCAASFPEDSFTWVRSRRRGSKPV